MTYPDFSSSGPDYFENETFENLVLEAHSINDKSFYGCTFQNSQLHKLQCINCLFEECVFISCDLSAAKFKGTRLVDVSFKHAKVTGINWTETRQPIQAPKYVFNDCVLSYSSFMDMVIKEAEFIDCIAHEVSFQGAQLNNAVFKNTDLAGAQFNQTNLETADLSSAINYTLHPGENRLKGAKFSFPEAQALLAPFGIELI